MRSRKYPRNKFARQLERQRDICLSNELAYFVITFEDDRYGLLCLLKRHPAMLRHKYLFRRMIKNFFVIEMRHGVFRRLERERVQLCDFRELSCGASQTNRYGCKKLQVWRPCSSRPSVDLTYANCRDFICTRTHHIAIMPVNNYEIEYQEKLQRNWETWYKF